jgi:hypothetical protein
MASCPYVSEGRSRSRTSNALPAGRSLSEAIHEKRCTGKGKREQPENAKTSVAMGCDKC